MKRFYCTICKKIKRIRNYPKSVNAKTENGIIQPNPINRVGICSYHSISNRKVG